MCSAVVEPERGVSLYWQTGTHTAVWYRKCIFQCVKHIGTESRLLQRGELYTLGTLGTLSTDIGTDIGTEWYREGVGETDQRSCSGALRGHRTTCFYIASHLVDLFHCAFQD